MPCRDAGRPCTPQEAKGIPRKVIQGPASPRKSNSNNAISAAREKRKGKSLTPAKNSFRKHLAPSQQSMKPDFCAAYIHTRPGEQDRISCRSSPSRPSRSMHSVSSNTRKLGKTPIRRLSRLESLPTEILEAIFFFTITLSFDSAFLNLPRASVPLGSKLSSDYVRKELFLRMCSDPQPTKTHKHYQALAEFHKEHARTQSWILRQQWFTHDFVRHCIPDYLVSVVLRELKKQRLNWLNQDEAFMKVDLELTIRRYIQDNLENPPLSLSSPNADYIEHQWTEPVPSKRHIILGLSPSTGSVSLIIYHNGNPPLNGSEGPENPHFHRRWRIFSLNSATQIPSHLLHGPWTAPKIKLLELLICGGASVDWIRTTAGEVAERGFCDALQESNARALRALCICDNDAIPGKRKDASYTLSPSRGVGVIPSQKHLLVAIDHGCQEDVVETLLNAPESQCDLQDVQVVKRIHEMEQRGWLERATWLAERRDTDRVRRYVWTGKESWR